MIRETVYVTNGPCRLAKCVIAGALAALLALGMLVVSAMGASKAFADEGNDVKYTYTYTVFAGDGTIIDNSEAGDGTIVDYSEVSKSELPYGDVVSLSLDNSGDDGTATLIFDGKEYEVVPNDDRYYPKGIRLAGANDSEGVVANSKVTESKQYVIAYGLKADRVAYRVNYVDQAGNQLLDSQTFYGNVGDKPVVAFKYVEGYVPNALNITGTLSSDEAENVFEFVYAPDESGAFQVLYVTRGTALNTGPAEAMAGIAEGADEAAADAAAEGAPAELLDLDDDETPLASAADGGTSVATADASIVPTAILAVGLLALAAILIVLIVVFRKKANQTDAK